MFVKKGDVTRRREGERLRTRDFVPAGTRRWTEPVWQLSDRPRRPFGSHL